MAKKGHKWHNDPKATYIQICSRCGCTRKVTNNGGRWPVRMYTLLGEVTFNAPKCLVKNKMQTKIMLNG